MTLDQWFHMLGLGVVVSPAVLLGVLGVASLVGWRISERSSANLTEASVVFGLFASVAILCLMLATGRRYVPIELGDWVSIPLPDQPFHFHLKFVFDRLSVPFAILSFVLCGTIGAFTSRYLHREPGYNRFFVLFAIFLWGMIVSSLAGTIETLFLGWEFVGLSSALLVAYFHERTNPVRNGQSVWVIYRIADAAFLIAALTLHHLTGAGDFDGLTGTGAWPEGQASISESHALYVGLLLLVAAAGKSALVPFSGWLPRAMEGPGRWKVQHACLRTLQLLRAPTLLHDYHTLENAIGGRLQRTPLIWAKQLPDGFRAWLYRIAMERGYLDALLAEFVVRPFVSVFRWCDAMERRWTNLLSGGESRESDQVKAHVESLEEFV